MSMFPTMPPIVPHVAYAPPPPPPKCPYCHHELDGWSEPCEASGLTVLLGIGLLIVAAFAFIGVVFIIGDWLTGGPNDTLISTIIKDFKWVFGRIF